MRVLSWNVDGVFPTDGWGEKIRAQIDFLGGYDPLPDILMLQEVNTAKRELWRDLLKSELGYGSVEDTLDWAHQLGDIDAPPHHEFGHYNGNLIAIHDSGVGSNLQRIPADIDSGRWEDSEMKHWDTNFPEKILNTTIEVKDSTVDLWNIRTVPGSMYGEEKIKILENTYHRIKESNHDLRILAGDLNAPKAELSDGTVVPWRSDKEGKLRDRWVAAELSIINGLGEFDMVDVFREIHGYGEIKVPDTSFQSRRFDHIFASSTLNPVDCSYDHDAYESFDDNNAYSDHAPVIAEFDP